MRRALIVAFRMALATIVVFSVLYPVAVWGVSAVVFPRQASGSMVEADGTVVGSRFIGQVFVSDEYFHGRPSYAGDGYDAMSSGASNLGPTNEELVASVKSRVDKVRAATPNRENTVVPVDLVTGSVSGLDPHISVDAAYVQVARIARTRRMPVDDVKALVAASIESRDLGILGEPRVNVLALNMALDEAAQR